MTVPSEVVAVAGLPPSVAAVAADSPRPIAAVAGAVGSDESGSITVPNPPLRDPTEEEEEGI